MLTDPLHINFTSRQILHAKTHGKWAHSHLAKATGISSRFKPHIVDGTAGNGKDAFMMASLGCQVTLLERNAAVYDALQAAIEDAALHCPDVAAEIQNMTLLHTNFVQWASNSQVMADVVYLDPMFPKDSYKAAVKQDMQALHQIVGMDKDADTLLTPALDICTYRVVVKRPKGAPYLADKTPSHEIKGKSNRFDIYTKKAIPK